MIGLVWLEIHIVGTDFLWGNQMKNQLHGSTSEHRFVYVLRFHGVQVESHDILQAKLFDNGVVVYLDDMIVLHENHHGVFQLDNAQYFVLLSAQCYGWLGGDRHQYGALSLWPPRVPRHSQTKTIVERVLHCRAVGVTGHWVHGGQRFEGIQHECIHCGLHLSLQGARYPRNTVVIGSRIVVQTLPVSPEYVQTGRRECHSRIGSGVGGNDQRTIHVKNQRMATTKVAILWIVQPIGVATRAQRSSRLEIENGHGRGRVVGRQFVEFSLHQ